MGVGKKVLNDVKPYMMMILLQIGYAGMYIVSVASLKRGMSHYVLVTYRNLAATLVMLPFALVFEKYVLATTNLSISTSISSSFSVHRRSSCMCMHVKLF